jgi:prepilin peptidase CpaA
VSVLLALAMLALLLTAAWRDLITRTIPDTVSLLLLAAGGLARFLESASAVALSAGAALLLLVLLTAAFSRGWIGGGDVKIMTAFSVGLPPFDCYRFVVATAIAGGVLAAAYILLAYRRKTAFPIRNRSLFVRMLAIEAWRMRRRGPLPYGVAIAAGGAFVLLR